MDDQSAAISLLKSVINIYQFSGVNTWTAFWEKYFSKRLSFQEAVLDNFIAARCQEIADSLSLLERDHSAAQQFLTQLPLNHLDTLTTWPPTSEQIRLIMSD